MNSLRNLKDAGKLLPAWTLPLFLASGIIGAFFFAQDALEGRPHHLVSIGTLYAVIGSLALAALTLLNAILSAKPGELSESMQQGFIKGLNFVWTTSSVALVVFAGALPVYDLMMDNLAASLSAVVATCVLAFAYYVSKPKSEANAQPDAITGIIGQTGLAPIPAQFLQTQEQKPAFQVSMADLTRLMIHQAGRLIAYKGSNCVIADSFSADLDLNARTAKIFSEMNMIATPEFLFWRMHMVMMGSAAEHVVRNTTSEAAMDDFQNFDELAARYMLLSDGKSSFYRPASEAEAAIKATRMGMMRKQVYSRCITACELNKKPLLDLVRLMRGQHCLAYRDIKHILDRIEMPADFPVAEFDTDEVMERALLAIGNDSGPDYVEHVADDPARTESQPQSSAPNVYSFQAS